MKFICREEGWRLNSPFRISRETVDEVPVVYLELSSEGHCGRAEAAGVDYRGETPASMIAEIENYLNPIDCQPTREALLQALPAGGARNAIDCALWDLEAKQQGVTATTLAGVAALGPVETAFTVSLSTPEKMAEAASEAIHARLLKIKLGDGAQTDIDRVAAVRAVAKSSRLIVDVNEGWDIDALNFAAPRLAAFGVELIEQPISHQDVGALADYNRAVDLCADESIDDQLTADIRKYYQCVNIKLDKTGGLTAALRLARQAREAGLKLFVGNMLGTSLAMAPAFIVGQLCDYVDLDGPLLLLKDRDPAIPFHEYSMSPFTPALWG